MVSFNVEDFIRIESALQASFSPNGNKISFRSNRSGVFQVFLGDAAGERSRTPVQLTDKSGVIYYAKFRPKHKEILYVSDEGGNEQFQLHLLGIDDSSSRPIAALPGIIHNPGAFSGDGCYLSYTSNKRDRRFFDVYIMDVDADREQLVYKQDGMNIAGRFNGDATALLVRRPNLDTAAGDNDLYLIDLASQDSPANLTKHIGVAQWSGACFHPSGLVFALSDEDRDFIGLQQIDPRKGERSYILEFDWDIETFVLSPDGSLAAVVVNEDGFSHLLVYALSSDGRIKGKIDILEPPAGIISDMRWRPDGGALVFSFSSAGQTSDVWILDLNINEVQKVTNSEIGNIPEDALPEPRLIRYPTFDGKMIPAFFYMPPDAKPDKKLPCMVIVHGGPEAQSRPSLWGTRGAGAVYLLATGKLTILVPNVRGSTGYGKEYAHADDVEKRMDCVRDLLAAHDWLCSNEIVDPDRIGVMGGSYGGFMTLAAITEAPDRWAAAVDLFGIANFETFLERTGPWRRKHRAAEYGDDPALLRSISPIHKADRIQTPLLVIQGDQDVRVPPYESEQIVETIRQKGGTVEYILFPQEGHGIQKIENRLIMERKICEFLQTYLL